VTGGGGNAGPVTATANLLDTFQNVGQFTKTPLNSGNNTIAVGTTVLSNANQTPNAPIDDLKIEVTIPKQPGGGIVPRLHLDGLDGASRTQRERSHVNIH
jgi:hypothetical protein